MYYYSKDGREIGPVGADRLVQLFDQGVVTADDMVRIDGTVTWLAAVQVVPTLRGHGLPGRTAVVVGLGTRPYGSPAQQPAAPPRGRTRVYGFDGEPAPAEPEQPFGASHLPTGTVPVRGATPREPSPAHEAATVVAPVTSTVVAPVTGTALVPAATVREPVRRALEPTAARPSPPHDEEPVRAPERRTWSTELTRSLGTARVRAVAWTVHNPLLAAVAGLAVVCVLSIFAVAHFTTTLASDLPPPGVVSRTEHTVLMRRGRAVLKTGAYSVKGTVSLEMVTVTELAAKSSDEYRLKFVNEQTTRVLHLPGQPPMTHTERGSLHGRTVTFRRKDASFQASLEGATPTPEQRQRVDELGLVPNGYPTGRLWPGKSWTVDAQRYCHELALFGECTGDAWMIFERFVKFKGERSAHVTYSVDLEGKREASQVKVTLTGDTYRSVARRLDLESVATGTMNWAGPLEPGGASRLDITGAVEVRAKSLVKGG